MQRGPEIFKFNFIRGYVIGKESCNVDESKDNWLVDFSYGTNNPKVGDTLLVNGITYTNVLKTRGLDQELKIIGLKVIIDYTNISTNKVITSGCNITTPITYELNEFNIKTQGEIR